MNYYTGAERLFRRVAAQLGGIPPQSDRWHAHLLEGMALDLPKVRPALLIATPPSGSLGCCGCGTCCATSTLGPSAATPTLVGDDSEHHGHHGSGTRNVPTQ
jgi:hypothetical protein